MPRAVYSTRFLAFSTTSTEEETYTVPSGFVAVLRDVDVYHQGGAADGWSVQLVDPLCYLMTGGDTGSAGLAQWSGRQIFNAGEQLQGTLYSAGDLASMMASGYLLAL